MANTPLLPFPRRRELNVVREGGSSAAFFARVRHEGRSEWWSEASSLHRGDFDVSIASTRPVDMSIYTGEIDAIVQACRPQRYVSC
ncbi:MAG: hypothetical protein V3V20_07790 [Algisphaera sp.]